MNPNYLDFEQPIADLDSKIDELKHLSTESGINIAEEVARLQTKSKSLTEKNFFRSHDLAKKHSLHVIRSVPTPLITSNI
jgi:Acetyl-CoA carboxylase alpha subunit